MIKKQIRVGVIGYGYAARVFHLPLICTIPGFFLGAIASRQYAAVKEKYPHVICHENYNDLIESRDIDLIIVLSPNHCHFEQAKAALLHDKHVIIDKPFTLSIQECDELLKIAKERNLMTSVFHNRRWDSDFLTLQKLVEKKQLGEILTFESSFDSFKPKVGDKWKEQEIPGAGILYDIVPHLIDQAITLFGIPISILAKTNCLRQSAKVPDFFLVILSYVRQEIILKASHCVKKPAFRFQVNGSLGSVTFVGRDNQEKLLADNIFPGAKDWKSDGNVQALFHAANGAEESLSILPGNYRQYYEDTCEAINLNNELPVTARQMRTVVQLTEAAILSAESGRCVEFCQSSEE